jgi:Imm-5 like putative immunity protein
MARPPGKLTLGEEDRRILAAWAAGCAERVLPLFEARVPGDTRPREAISGARAFARGEMSIGRLRDLSVRAHAAARAVGDPAATAAARAAGHAAATAHMAAHARGAAAYAALALALSSPPDDSAVRWQRASLSDSVRTVLRKLPAPPRSSSRLGTLVTDLHREVNETT